MAETPTCEGHPGCRAQQRGRDSASIKAQSVSSSRSGPSSRGVWVPCKYRGAQALSASERSRVVTGRGAELSKRLPKWGEEKRRQAAMPPTGTSRLGPVPLPRLVTLNLWVTLS